MSGAELIEVGYVQRAHGVRGELRIVLHNPESDALDRATEVVIGESQLAVVRTRSVDGAYLLTLDGLDDRDRAAECRGKKVWVKRELIDLGEDELLLVDLIGCEAVLPNGEPFGEIVSVETGLQDRLVVHFGEIERLLPMVDEFLVEVDLDAKKVVVDPPEDLPEAPIRRKS